MSIEVVEIVTIQSLGNWGEEGSRGACRQYWLIVRLGDVIRVWQVHQGLVGDLIWSLLSIPTIAHQEKSKER